MFITTSNTERMEIAVEILVFTGVFVVSSGFVSWWKNLRKDKRRTGQLPPPSPPPPPAFPSLPIIGSVPFIRGWNNIPDFFLKSVNQFGSIFTLQVGKRQILILNSGKSIEEAYVSHSNAFSGRSETYISKMVNPDRKGIVDKNTTPEWKKIHKLSLSILKDFGFGEKNLMEERILTEVEEMIEYLRNKNGQTLCPREITAMVSTNVINNIIFARRFDYESGVGEIFVQMQRAFEAIDIIFDVAPIARFLPLYRKKLNVLNESKKIIHDIIREEIERCKRPEADDCFVRRYLEEEGSDCDEEELVFSVFDLIAGGSDTTITTLLWSLIALANHPEVQDRMRKEIDAVVPRQRSPTIGDERNMPYVEATILEIMRWKTLVPLSLPRETLADVRINGYFIPKGIMVLANIYAAHMDPKIWIDANEFRPERFLDDEDRVIGRDRVMTFSLGRRSCLGKVLARAEIFLVVSSLIQNFIIQPPDGQDKVEVKALEPVGMTMIPLPFCLQLIPRNIN